jgi:hypothetical protein
LLKGFLVGIGAVLLIVGCFLMYHGYEASQTFAAKFNNAIGNNQANQGIGLDMCGGFVLALIGGGMVCGGLLGMLIGGSGGGEDKSRRRDGSPRSKDAEYECPRCGTGIASDRVTQCPGCGKRFAS